ncbi:hypothetical protein [Nocardia thailandica]|uniref:hypothetical protein n=1 Tax=Nocardia thailandica TaxID=257275 RepID=UPI00031C5660|nr:hypothetical protein [Nocardia thailandica]
MQDSGIVASIGGGGGLAGVVADVRLLAMRMALGLLIAVRRAEGRAGIAWALAMFTGPVGIVPGVLLGGQALFVLRGQPGQGRDLAVGALVAAAAWGVAVGFSTLT